MTLANNDFIGRGELNITGPAGAGQTLVTLEFRHSYNR